jgi:hypothetical protein
MRAIALDQHRNRILAGPFALRARHRKCVGASSNVAKENRAEHQLIRGLTKYQPRRNNVDAVDTTIESSHLLSVINTLLNRRTRQLKRNATSRLRLGPKRFRHSPLLPFVGRATIPRGCIHPGDLH